jgi:hypothetical protein
MKPCQTLHEAIVHDNINDSRKIKKWDNRMEIAIIPPAAEKPPAVTMR